MFDILIANVSLLANLSRSSYKNQYIFSQGIRIKDLIYIHS
jgi:hypothetical protein